MAKDPRKVTGQADADALASYWDARDYVQHDLNAKAPHMTVPVIESIREKLDQSFTAYSFGLDRAAFANLGRDAQRKLDLWASALIYYANAQLYSQVKKNSLEKVNTVMP